MLGSVAGPTAHLQPTTTNPMHISAATKAADPKSGLVKNMYEIKPGGNGVDLEEQMVKQTQNGMDYSLMTTLYQKNMGMLRTAIGN